MDYIRNKFKNMAKKKHTKRGLVQDKKLVAKDEVSNVIRAEKKKGITVSSKRVRETVKEVGHSRKKITQRLEDCP
jgi:hypothetical protein